MADLRLIVLGCSGSYPGPGSACSGYIVQGGGVNVAVDLGPGCLANLQEHIDLADIDAVVLSHSHPDHWVDLTGLETAWKYGLGREGLPVFGTAETREKATAVIGDLEPVLAWTDLADGDTHCVGDLVLDFSETEHYVDTLAVRVTTAGKSLAYSADTGPGWSFAEFGPDIDLGLCEATNLADGEGEGVLHLSARQAGSMAKAAGVRRLVLTHFLPGSNLADYQLEGDAAFGQHVELASIHAHYDV